MSSAKLTVRDCRKAGFCVAGARDRARLIGEDPREFIKHGLDLEKMRLVDDAQIQEAVRQADLRIAGETE